jgi:MFS family permease
MGAGLANASLATLASLLARPEQQGRVAGLFRSLGSLARVLGPIGGCFFFWKMGSAFTYAAACALVLTALALCLPLRRQATET